MAYWHRSGSVSTDLASWQQSLRLACDWLIEKAMVTTKHLDLSGGAFQFAGGYQDWRGAFRGEYAAAQRRWDVFGPVWHGGQAVKALVLAHGALGEPLYLQKAAEAADFILRNQVSDAADPDCGFIRAYESDSTHVNSSAILEALDGLFALAEATGQRRYADAALNALRWVQQRMFLPVEGLVQDEYDLESRTVHLSPTTQADRQTFPQPGRPLMDDGVFIKGFELTGDVSLKETAAAIADRLLADEAPAGNWKAYAPCVPATGLIHPRHAYWWGRPLWMVAQATGQSKYLDCCRRSASWYVQAMRSDGGLFRDTWPDFKTPSFGQATSGVACAAILWHDLAVHAGDKQWHEPMQRALRFCRSVQFTQAADPNLQGAILEKVMPPDGSDAPPWYLRDLGTTFYIQAVSLALRNLPAVLTAK